MFRLSDFQINLLWKMCILYFALRVLLYVILSWELIYALPLLLISIFLFIFLLALFIIIYFNLKKYIRNKFILICLTLILFHITAYFTMDDFHLILDKIKYPDRIERSLLQTLKHTQSAGFNYISFLLTIIILLVFDHQKNRQINTD